MNNAVKYSGSGKIEIKASIKNKSLLLLVKDYGKGFSPEITGRGNGLDNMKNRAQELNGKLEIESGVNKGTTIALTLPL